MASLKEKIQELVNMLKCQSCDARLSSKRNLARHVKTHKVDNIIHKCDICNRNFRLKHYLDKHLKSHKAATRVLEHCKEENCDKEYYSKVALRQHQKLHENKPRKYSCEHCDYSTDSSYYIVHHRNIHNDLKFPCEICGYNN